MNCNNFSANSWSNNSARLVSILRFLCQTLGWIYKLS
nr:MAG TPA: hypothetical protein [Caudoviricetes sp.]